MKFNLYTSVCALLSVMILTAGCEKEYATIEEIDKNAIDQYIQANQLTGFKDSLGVTYKIVKEGTGENLKYSQVVPLIFTVRSLDGRYISTDTLAASNRYGAAGGADPYGRSIATEFLGYFGREKSYPNDLKVAVVELLKKRGGEIRVLVPSKEAYGRNGYGDIPGNASLDYSIKVLTEDSTKLAAYDQISIQKYITANNLTGFTTTSSGLRYKISNQGTGSPITKDSTVTVDYTAKLLNGKVFEQSSDTFLLSNMIKGWQEGLSLIREGGTIRLLIPSALAYGLAGSRGRYGDIVIPTASALDFEITVTKVED